MAEISQRKSEQSVGSESILMFMGITFLLIDLILVIIVLISSSFNRILMTPILYYLTLAGLFIGIGAYLKEHNHDLRHFKNWMYSLLFLGILAGAVVGSIIWT